MSPTVTPSAATPSAGTSSTATPPVGTPATPRCQVSRGLEVFGQKWTLLVLREAMWGRTRFAEFRARLGVAPDILTDRLTRLVENGVLERRAYREAGERERTEYVLTDAGRDTVGILAAMVTWGDEHRPTGYGPATTYVEEGTDVPVRLAFVDATGREVPARDVRPVRGPGATPLP